MASPVSLTQNQARKIVLVSQSLHSHRGFAKGAKGTLAAIEHLGYVQIDTLAVVERAHSHTLWNRVPSFRPSHIDQLQQEGKIFEHWAHALAYLPIDDFRFSLPMMNRIANGEIHWYKKNNAETKRVLKRIQEEGPLSAKDFDDKKASTDMWSRSPSKQALEQLFMEGKLMIPQRVNFHKVYDLTENVLPEGVSTELPTTEELCRHLISSFLRAHGIGQLSEIAYLRKGLKSAIKLVAAQMEEDGEISKVVVDETDYYCLPSALELANKTLPSGLVRILSPFDNAVIQRKRLLQLFDYDYQIECYVPKAKRKFGYFCLPILYNSSLVGRIDAKAVRSTGELQLLHLHIEKPVRQLDSFYSKLHKELQRFARFNGCSELTVQKVSGAAAPQW